MEQNQDLFADDHASLGQLVDRLDQIPASELTAKWPKALSELVDVLACELARGGMGPEQAKAQARKLALVQAHYMGAGPTTSPPGIILRLRCGIGLSGMSSTAEISMRLPASTGCRYPRPMLWLRSNDN